MQLPQNYLQQQRTEMALWCCQYQLINHSLEVADNGRGL